jgi:starvation-inducible outer membrane lipoprotein
MVRNLILGLFCLVLVGCAAGPSPTVSTSDSATQKRQAVKAEPLTE